MQRQPASGDNAGTCTVKVDWLVSMEIKEYLPLFNVVLPGDTAAIVWVGGLIAKKVRDAKSYSLLAKY